MAEAQNDGLEQARRYGQLVAKSWLDPAFKARLLADPGSVLREEGFDVPAGQQIQVLEPGPERAYLVLGPTALGQEPAEAEPVAAVLARAQADPTYKARLLAEPTAVLSEAGMPVPAAGAVAVLEADETHGYLFLPPQPADLVDTVDAGGEVFGYLCGTAGGQCIACVFPPQVSCLYDTLHHDVGNRLPGTASYSPPTRP